MNSTTIKLADKEFFPKNATKHYIVYFLEKYAVKNGSWYRYNVLVPSLQHFRFKCFRSEATARKIYDDAVALEQWRNDKV